MVTKDVVLKILKVLAFIAFVVFLGSVGYMMLEGYEVLDAVYMTVITLTTTGFREIAPLSERGKIFTIVLLLTGVGVVTYSLSSIVSYIASIDFSKRRREKMEKKIAQMKGHAIVCGYGRMGEIICRKLSEEGVPFVVIEKKPQLVGFLKQTNYLYIEGDAANDDNLMRAGIENAKTLLTVIDSDADALYISLAGRSFNPEIYIIARANEPNAQKRMIRAGANKVVLPFVMSGMKVAETVINPEVEDFFRLPDTDAESNEFMRIADLFVTEDTDLAGKSLKEIGPKLEGIIVIGIRKEDKSFLFKPDSSYVFQLGDCLVTMGEGTTHQKLHESFKAA